MTRRPRPARDRPARDRLALAGLLLLSAGLFFTALDWGLPSRDADRYLFGDRQPWSGEEILRLAGGWADRGDLPSDLDADPLDRTAGPVVLNDTDAKRAAIVLRYRLYSYQPDEMQTFRALASMRPGRGDLDPRFYLYGGLWVYPVGGLLKLASLFGWVTLRTDLPYYLDHPEAFGRFYIVARAYSAAWGVAGVWVCYLLGRRLGGSASAGLLAGLLFALLPVTVNAAHEAKPHLAGAVLSLAAILPASRYVTTGRRRWAVASGVLCGAAAGMVLSGASAFAVVAAMAYLRWWRPSFARSVLSDGAIASAAGAVVYAWTNPYVVLNLLRGRSVVGENVGHLGTFYTPTAQGIPSAVWLLGLAASPGVVVAGLVGAVWLAFDWWRGPFPREVAEDDCKSYILGKLIAVLAVATGAPFLLLAAGWSADYGRFALVPAACLGVLAVVPLGLLNPKSKYAGLTGLVVGSALLSANVFCAPYLAAFMLDRNPPTTRTNAADEIVSGQSRVVLTSAEPAPYVLPPVDLWRRRIVLVPAGTGVPGAMPGPPADLAPVVRVRAVDDPMHAPIAWADKRFEIIGVPPADGPNDAAMPLAEPLTRP